MFLAIFYVLILSIFQLFKEVRGFSIIHIICCVVLLVSFKYSHRLYIIVLKIWSGILFISGSLILLSSCLYLLTGNSNKISYTGNILAVTFVVIALVLYKYRDLAYDENIE